MQSAQRIDLVAVQGPSTTNTFTSTLRLAMKPKLLFPGQDRAQQGPPEPKKRPLADLGLGEPARSVSRTCHGELLSALVSGLLGSMDESNEYRHPCSLQWTFRLRE